MNEELELVGKLKAEMPQLMKKQKKEEKEEED